MNASQEEKQAGPFEEPCISRAASYGSRYNRTASSGSCRRGTSRSEARAGQSDSIINRELQFKRAASNRSQINGTVQESPDSATALHSPNIEFRAAFTAARHLVSGNRSRFIDDQYDLDLTYITDRIIAIAFPGEDLLGAFSTLIRNDIR